MVSMFAGHSSFSTVLPLATSYCALLISYRANLHTMSIRIFPPILIFLIATAIPASARIEIAKPFVKRALDHIPTPTAVPAKHASGGHYVSLAALVQLPQSNPWNALATPAYYPRQSSETNWPLILLIVGAALVIIGGAVSLYAFAKDDTDASKNSLTAAGNATAILGGAACVTGVLLKTFRDKENKKGSWY
jgi:hypothetical protein